MKTENIYINESPTFVMTYGKWIEEKFSENEKEIAIVIPGNPGFADFYATFGENLYNQLGIPIWILSYAGHEALPSSKKLKSEAQFEFENVKLFSLKEQVDHIAEFIRRYVPPDVKIHIIAHSCGSWMTLELLKLDDIKKKIKKSYFLFPTIERLKQTNGFYLVTKLIIPFQNFFLGLAYIFHSIIPFFIRLFLYKVALKVLSLPDYMVKPSMKIIHPQILPNVIHLVAEEQIHINKIDIDCLRENKNNIKLLYSDADPFVPKKFYYELKEAIPDINAEITYMNHGFMVNYDVKLAKVLANWIKTEM